MKQLRWMRQILHLYAQNSLKGTYFTPFTCCPTSFFACLFYMQPLIASDQIIRTHGTDVCFRIRLLIGETLFQTEYSTGRRWDFNPGPCRWHDYCCKRAKPLHHQATCSWMYYGYMIDVRKLEEQMHVPDMLICNWLFEMQHPLDSVRYVYTL